MLFSIVLRVGKPSARVHVLRAAALRVVGPAGGASVSASIHRCVCACLGLVLVGCLGAFSPAALSADQQKPDTAAALAEQPAALPLRNFHPIDALLATAGEISDAQVHALAALGYEYVINLAVSDPARSNRNEAFAVTRNGLSYAQIPVDWQQPTERDLQLFFALMDARGGRKTLVHCFANYRASAFVYLYRTVHLGEDEATARADLDALWTEEVRARHPHWVAFIAQQRGRCTSC